jgi:hypothetical protein
MIQQRSKNKIEIKRVSFALRGYCRCCQKVAALSKILATSKQVEQERQ